MRQSVAKRSVGQHFGTPAAAGTEHDVAIHAASTQKFEEGFVIEGRKLQRKVRDRAESSGAAGKLAILVGNVRAGGLDAVGVEERHAIFPDGFRGEADAFGHSGEKRQACGLPETLIVDGGFKLRGANFANALVSEENSRVSTAQTFEGKPLLATSNFQRGG